MRGAFLAAVFLLAVSPLVALGCSGVALFGDGVVVVGGNEDQEPAFFDDQTMWALPASDSTHGAVFFGLWLTNLGDRQPGWYEMQGVNDQGLYFDLFATPCPPGNLRPIQRPVWWKPEPLEQVMLQRCATVKDAVGFLSGRGYRWSVPCTQVLLVDRAGSAAVYTDTGVVFRDPTSSFFVVTNFDLAMPSLGNWPCDRYDAITALLREDSTATVDRAGEVLSTVTAWTLYSVVCDLIGGTADVYFNKDFTARARLDLVPFFAGGLPVTSLSSLTYAPSNLTLPPPSEDMHGP